ncbi:hypothetical protein EZS27_018775 [termite gut metagenome]|uniref:Translocation and assembly module TamB C-terminal domain-containing protein n=1 Tax=termite gut metagenome TaxID=433724 RepID=A0A5J4RGH7_9ZZZZ
MGIIILLNTPYVRQKIVVTITEKLSKMIDAELNADEIHVGFLFNRITVDNALLKDKSGKEMLKASRILVNFSPLSFLLHKQIYLSNVQLFGLDAYLNRENPESEPNFMFLINAFTSKDTAKKMETDLRVNSFLIRHGKFTYDVLSEKETPGRFNTNHIKLYNLIGDISLKVLKNDTLNASIKRLSFGEQSGLELKKLTLQLLGNNRNARAENFTILLPGTSIQSSIYFNYDSITSFKQFAEEARFRFEIHPSSYFTLQDASPFIPALVNFKEKMGIKVSANGTLNRLNCSEFQINVGDFIKTDGNVFVEDLLSPASTTVKSHIKFTTGYEGVNFLFSHIKNTDKAPVFLQHFGDISFQGDISGDFTNFVLTDGIFDTASGKVNTDFTFYPDKEKNQWLYSGKVQTEDFDLGNFLNNQSWGNTAFNLNINGQYENSQHPAATLKGLISHLKYNEYDYKNIILTGEYKYGKLGGEVELNDKNGSVLINGMFNSTKKIPEFNFHADIKNVCPNAFRLISSHKDEEFSLKIDANLAGHSLSEIEGKIDIDSISFVSPKSILFIKNFNLSTVTFKKTKKLTINSDFLKGKIEGEYSYQTIPATFVNLLQDYTPALLPVKKNIETKNDFIFDLHIFNTEFFSAIFDIPLDIHDRSTITGYFNDYTKQVQVIGDFPFFQYGNKKFKSGRIFFGNPDNQLKGEIKFDNSQKDSTTTKMCLNVQVRNNVIDTTINWENDSEKTYSGELSISAGFSRTEEKKSSLNTVVDIKETKIIVNNAFWEVHPSQIVVTDSGKIHINNFYLTHDEQYARVNGYVSNDVNDTIKIDLKRFNIGYIFDVFNLKKVNFDGIASGKVYLNRMQRKMMIKSQLVVENFSFNGSRLGDANIAGEWREEQKGIYLNADIKEGNVSQSKVTGYIYPLKPKSGLDLDIRAENLNIYFLQPYLASIVSNLTARASGKVRMFGSFKNLDFEGGAKVNAGMKVDILNTNYTFTDSIRMKPSEFLFNNITLHDREGHSGTFNGNIHHQNLKDMNYRMSITSDNMLVMDIKENADLPFYGTVYGRRVNASLFGNSQGLNVDVALTPTRNTNFVYGIKKASSATNNRFVKFIDKTPQHNDSDSTYNSDYEKKKTEITELSSNVDIRLDITVDATPEATVKIIMDPVSGDFISGKGTGNLHMNYYNKGDIKLFGNYIINQGIYKFSLQELIRKDFIIKEGSSINFNGAPLNTTLDVQAIYTVNSASLNDLILENAEISKQPNVKVNCKMNLTGNLSSPDIKMDIELPNEREEIRALVHNYLNTEEEMNMQILYLLGIGKFYTTDNTNTQQNPNLMPSVLSSTLSGQLNNMLSQIIDNNNWNFGTNLSTNDKGWTDVEGVLSGQLLDNRLLINGNLGYRDRPLATTNFVGDFDTELLLTRTGDVRLKAYNQTSDRYYIRSTNFTKQGLGIMYKKDFDKWSDLLFVKRKKRKE